MAMARARARTRVMAVVWANLRHPGDDGVLGTPRVA